LEQPTPRLWRLSSGNHKIMCIQDTLEHGL
jgi:hypothetical protein